MGKFDLDDVLKDLGDPDPNAPKEPSPAAPVRSEGAEPVAAPSQGGSMFVRKDPAESPRPPDFTGTGLGREIEHDIAAGKADPTRRKPADALSPIYNPDEDEAAAGGASDNQRIRASLALSLQNMGLMDRTAATWRSLWRVDQATP